ncbi:MAG: hypothetical protein IKS83_09150, partial [Victivallales bacterium]|nr:hypothetical protein [Victivallales bacterium]
YAEHVSVDKQFGHNVAVVLNPVKRMTENFFSCAMSYLLHRQEKPLLSGKNARRKARFFPRNTRNARKEPPGRPSRSP